MSALVTAYQSLIPQAFVLKVGDGCWVVEEPGAAHNRLEIARGKSHAFTLDQPGQSVFPFFSNSLAGMKSVNDAIVVAVVGGEHYVVAVEMKTSENRVNDALKQIESGRRFIQWTRGLMNLHGHWPGGGCRFFGVVSLKPRSQGRKGTTSRSAQLPAPELSVHDGYPYFVLKNHPRVSVTDLVKKIVERHGQCKVAV